MLQSKQAKKKQHCSFLAHNFGMIDVECPTPHPVQRMNICLTSECTVSEGAKTFFCFMMVPEQIVELFSFLFHGVHWGLEFLDKEGIFPGIPGVEPCCSHMHAAGCGKRNQQGEVYIFDVAYFKALFFWWEGAGNLTSIWVVHHEMHGAEQFAQNCALCPEIVFLFEGVGGPQFWISRCARRTRTTIRETQHKC